jgi:hypothetical protein
MGRPVKASTLALTGIFTVYLIARLVVALGGEVFVAPDSAVYRYDPARNFGSLISLTGHAPRPWGLPVFYALFPDDLSRAWGQWALGTAAWAFLAWELSRHMRTAVGRVAAVTAVLGFALFATVNTWDFAMLTESLSISIGVAVVAFLLWWGRTGSRGALAAATGLTVWWTFLRPDIRVFTVVVIVVLAFAAFRVWRHDGGRITARAGAPIVAAVVMLGAIGWYSAITPAMNKTFAPYDGDAIPESPMPMDEEIFVYRLRVDVSTDPQLYRTFREELGMPLCPGTEAYNTKSAWDSVGFAREYTKCPELREWVQRNKNRFWPELASKAPSQAARKFYQNTSYALGGVQYAKTGAVIPAPLEKLAFPSRTHGLPYGLAYLAVALALALLADAGRRHPLLLKTAGVMVVAALGSALATVYVHSGEYLRFGIQEAIALRVAAILLLVAAIDAFAARRQMH